MNNGCVTKFCDFAGRYHNIFRINIAAFITDAILRNIIIYIIVWDGIWFFIKYPIISGYF